MKEERGLYFNSYKSSITSPFLMNYHSIQPIPWLPSKFKDLMWQSKYYKSTKYYKSNSYACKRFTLSSTPRIYNHDPNLPKCTPMFPWTSEWCNLPFSPSQHYLKCPLKIYTISLTLWLGLRQITFNIFPYMLECN